MEFRFGFHAVFVLEDDVVPSSVCPFLNFKNKVKEFENSSGSYKDEPKLFNDYTNDVDTGTEAFSMMLKDKFINPKGARDIRPHQ